VLDITFYRDDLSLRKGMPLVRATEIDFDLDGKLVLLVDDVLATGGASGRPWTRWWTSAAPRPSAWPC